MPKKSPNKAGLLAVYDMTADKKPLYENLIDENTHLVLAFNELENVLKENNYTIQAINSSIDVINAAFRRIGVPDRIANLNEIGTVVANFLWKRQCSSDIPHVLNVLPTEKIPDETT